MKNQLYYFCEIYILCARYYLSTRTIQRTEYLCTIHTEYHRHKQWHSRGHGTRYSRLCYLKRNPHFIRVNIFAFPARHIYTCTKITLRHVQVTPVIAFVIITALPDLVPYSPKIRPCHRAGRAKIDMPYKKRLNEQEHVREWGEHIELILTRMWKPPVISNCVADYMFSIYKKNIYEMKY